MTLVARTACDGTSCDPSIYAQRIRDAVHAAEAHAPISDVLTMSGVVDNATADAHFYLVLLTAFAGVALALAAVGIYGVMSYAVSRRTREIGIRVALGAEPGVVLGAIVGEGMRLATLGAVSGVVLSLLLTRLMRGILFGVGPNDLITLGGVAGMLMFVALVASLVPAIRATRIDPLEALRE
jgi:putative ABC transport system permease protein